MEGLLTQITLIFKQASLVWAPTIGGLMEPVLINLIVIGWFFLLVSECLMPSIGMFGPIMLFLVGQGFALWMVRDGHIYIADVFDGVNQIGIMLGATLDPSALAGLGNVVAYPILKSLADQGILSFVFSPTTWVYTMAALAFYLVFWVLAAMEMGGLILSYILTAMCPFFFAFAGTIWTRQMVWNYIQLIFGCLGFLVAVLMITCVSRETAELLQQQLAAHFLVTGITRTLADYAVALGVALVLLFFIVWLPIHIGRAVGAVVPSIAFRTALTGYAGAALGAAGGAAMSIGSSISSTLGGGSGGGGGSSPQVAAASAGGGSGSGSGSLPQSAPASQWSGRP